MTAQAPYSVGGDATRKSRGAFYTPSAITDFLVSWAVRSSTDSVLEPSCGEAAFLTSVIARLQGLTAALRDDQIVGVEIHPEALANAGAIIQAAGVPAQLYVSDFFAFRSDRLFDAVVGNPPYVRYQSFTGTSRTAAQEAALRHGVRIAGLSNSWAPFVVHAASFVAPHGRLALVLPAELLTVNYAAPVRRFLMARFASVRLVLFEERVFPGVMEEVLLLLAEGQGPTDHCDLLQTKNLSTLRVADGQQWRPAGADEKWLTGLLPPDAAALYADAVSGLNFSSLVEWGETSLGMVTGNNRYFTLTAARARELHLKPNELLAICPPGSRHLRGLGFAEKAWTDMIADGAAGYLFAPSPTNPSPEALAYIKAGEAQRVQDGYKCRNRSPWWRVPRVPIPNAFVTYMNHDTARIVTNRAGVAYLNSVHGLTFAPEHRELAMDLLPMASLNTVTLLGSELVGRSYGGGLLKLEPKEADRLPVPSVVLVEAAEAKLRGLRPQLAKALRQGKLLDVVDEVDKVLRPFLKLSRADLDKLRAARAALFNRRVTRAQGRQ
jgi:adenine-specific DNA-methyltransferase